jgi:beta-glucanase (GH16 family)
VGVIGRITAASVAVAGVCAFGTSAGASTAPSPSCGPTIHKANGQAWVCTLDDEFSGTSLNSAHWTPFTSVAGGFRGGAECYTPKNVSVANGTLNLPTTRAAAPFDCAGTSASYYSGMVVSKQKFTQTYGRFQISAKIPMSKGLHAAFWLLPESSYNAQGQLDYGEIDVLESGGAYDDIASPHLHYVVTPGDAQSGNYCVVPNIATQFHTYTLEWTPTTMTFSYDGATCWKTTWQTAYPYQPLGAHAPAPFDQPFYLILNMGTDTAQTIAANAVSSSTNLSQPYQVDYVRAWT